jgi:glutathionylspermidine synthase
MGRYAQMTLSAPSHSVESASLANGAKSGSFLWTEAALDRETWLEIRRRAVLDGCKWDPQVGDIDTLSPFPLVMKASVWNQLTRYAEQLTAEAISAENEISHRPDLIAQLGLPRALRRILGDQSPLTPAAGTVMRFDFHYTTKGWRISEANSDVPGGFSEASYFTEMMAQHFPDLRSAGNPGDVWSKALASAAGFSGVVALLSAPGFMEDHQVVAFLARRLCEHGCIAHLAKPEHIVWRNESACLDTAWFRGPVSLIVKYYQAEWLARLPRKFGWGKFFRGGKTPVANPPLAVISESKRFPLLWDELSNQMPTWRSLLPETRDPCDAPWSSDDGWLLKTAMCNNGDTICIQDSMSHKAWLRLRMSVQLSPGNWIAQRRFDSVPVLTPVGPRHVCIGVYTVNGQAAGAYARLSEKPVIDFSATDVALLLKDDE